MKKFGFVLSIVALVLSLLALTLPVYGAIAITETFTNSTAPGWQLLGNATLTGGTVDPAGQGWLRLTTNANNQAGSAIYNTAFPSTEGIRIEFSYASYGGTGADGISFYLIDGATANPTVGAYGGSLGYSRGGETGIPGVTNGYIGIGLDEFGNFSSNISGDCNPSCPTTNTAESVSLRGSGNLNSGFNYLTHVPLSPRSVDGVTRDNARRVRVTIVDQRITVEIDFRDGAGFQTVINQYNLQNAPGQAAIPATFKMGFAGSTGGATNYHEIRNLVVNAARLTTTTLTSTPNPSTEGESVTFTATVTGTGGTPTGMVTFLNGATVLGTGMLDATGRATFSTTALPVGSHTITARYEGDPTFGLSTSSSVTQVVETRSTGTLTSDLSVTQTYTIRFLHDATFTITARNLGPDAANGAVVSNLFPAAQSNSTWTWTCAGSNGATCTPSGSGNINDTLTAFPSGGVVTYTVRGNIESWSRWTNTVSITAPTTVSDSITANNTATVGLYKTLLPIIRQ